MYRGPECKSDAAHSYDTEPIKLQATTLCDYKLRSFGHNMMVPPASIDVCLAVHAAFNIKLAQHHSHIGSTMHLTCHCTPYSARQCELSILCLSSWPPCSLRDQMSRENVFCLAHSLYKANFALRTWCFIGQHAFLEQAWTEPCRQSHCHAL